MLAAKHFTQEHLALFILENSCTAASFAGLHLRSIGMTDGYDSVERLLDIHKIQQVYLSYAAAMDSHQWDLMDRCFLEDAEIQLGSLGAQAAGGVSVVSPKEWQKICRATDSKFDAIQHFIYSPLIDINEDIAETRVYYIAQHVMNKFAPDAFFTIGGWYNSVLRRSGTEWRIARQAAASLWYSGNPEVMMGWSLPIGAQKRGPQHACPAWLDHKVEAI